MTVDEAAGRRWDVLVVGAGPAGAMAAREAARRSASVLLIDRAAFPRRKACGGCLNAVALDALRAAGLGALPARLGAQPLADLRLAIERQHAVFRLPPMMALSREVFDTALIEHAVLAGARFLPEADVCATEASAAGRDVIVHHRGRRLTLSANAVVAADGLGGRWLDAHRALGASVSRRSRIGVGVILEEAPPAYAAGRLFMACARGGYVGLVRLSGGQLAVAAALDPAFVSAQRGATASVRALLRATGLPGLDGLADAPWRGTPPFTRRRAGVAAERMFLIGDAAGYVEPFTGEGIAWALASGLAVAPLAVAATHRWAPTFEAQWTEIYQRLIGPRQQTCRLITRALRWTRLTQAAVRILSHVPTVAAPFVRRVNEPFRQIVHAGGNALRMVVE